MQDGSDCLQQLVRSLRLAETLRSLTHGLTRFCISLGYRSLAWYVLGKERCANTMSQLWHGCRAQRCIVHCFFSLFPSQNTTVWEIVVKDTDWQLCTNVRRFPFRKCLVVAQLHRSVAGLPSKGGWKHWKGLNHKTVPCEPARKVLAVLVVQEQTYLSWNRKG